MWDYLLDIQHREIAGFYRSVLRAVGQKFKVMFHNHTDLVKDLDVSFGRLLLYSENLYT